MHREGKLMKLPCWKNSVADYQVARLSEKIESHSDALAQAEICGQIRWLLTVTTTIYTRPAICCKLLAGSQGFRAAAATTASTAAGAAAGAGATAAGAAAATAEGAAAGEKALAGAWALNRSVTWNLERPRTADLIFQASYLWPLFSRRVAPGCERVPPEEVKRPYPRPRGTIQDEAS